MKSLCVLGVSAVLLAGLGGCATTRQADANLAKNATAAPKEQAFCIKDTGTRIKPKDGECVGPGRTYSREELDRTGSFNAAEALKKLDPAL